MDANLEADALILFELDTRDNSQDTPAALFVCCNEISDSLRAVDSITYGPRIHIRLIVDTALTHLLWRIRLATRAARTSSSPSDQRPDM